MDESAMDDPWGGLRRRAREQVGSARSVPGQVRTVVAESAAAPAACPGAALAVALLALPEARPGGLWLAPRVVVPVTLRRVLEAAGWRIRTEPSPDGAAVGLTTAADAQPELWRRLAGPGQAGLLVLDVPRIDDISPARHKHPPVEGAELMPWLRVGQPGGDPRQACSLGVAGIARHFWRGRPAQPDCGVDLLLCSGPRLAAIPSSARVMLGDTVRS